MCSGHTETEWCSYIGCCLHMQQQLRCSGHTDRVVFVYVTPASQKPPLKGDAHFPKYTHALLYLVPCEKRILTKLENSLARFARSLVIMSNIIHESENLKSPVGRARTPFEHLFMGNRQKRVPPVRFRPKSEVLKLHHSTLSEVHLLTTRSRKASSKVPY